MEAFHNLIRENYTEGSDNDVLPKTHSMRRRTKKAQPRTSRKSTKTNRNDSYDTRTQYHQVNETVTKWFGYGSDSSSEDDYLDKSYDTGRDDPDCSAPKIFTFNSRPTGPPHAGFRWIKIANKRIEELLSYRSYRLMVTNHTKSSKATAEARVHIKNLNLRMKNHTFDGTDLIRIFNFVDRFFNEGGMLNMPEAQALIALPTVLAQSAETQFRSELSGASLHGSINCWPGAIKYILRTY